jgi:signal transduction histidine kinase
LHRIAHDQDVIFSQVHPNDRWFELHLKPLRRSEQLGSPQLGSPQLGSQQLDQPTNSQLVYGLVLVLEDITPQKSAQENLETQIQQFQELSALKDDFLNTVSHELRSPMTNIQMAIELLKRTNPAKAATHYLQILQHEVAREVDLINDLLDLQRLEAGAQSFYPEEIQFQEWLPPLIQPFYERAQANQQTLQVNLPVEMPKVLSDEASLERVVTELVNNACKYTPAGEKITLAVQAIPPAPAPQNDNASQNDNAPQQNAAQTGEVLKIDAQPELRSALQISVTNSGAEIPPDELGRIFEKFYRVPQTDLWNRGGTGLGLSLVKKLVESLGGTIQVDSRSGETVFTVQLPATYPQKLDL